MAPFWQAAVLFQVLSADLFFPAEAAVQKRPDLNLSGYDHGSRKVLRRRQQDQIITTGALGNAANGSMPVRMEIRNMMQQEELWTLYILGLDWMQFTDQADPMSWYQVAGIHGRPFLAWDDVDGIDESGYCNHVSIIFPTWHRPYLALFEQVLYEIIQDIASWYPAESRTRYELAATTFRMPYWDWAMAPSEGQNVLPDIVSGPAGINIDGPAGVQLIANPLYSYRFKPLNTTELPDYPLSIWPETYRYPTVVNGTTVSRNDLVSLELNNNAQSFRDRLYNLFTNYANYTTFSNEAWIPSSDSDNEDYDSLESLHDQIHGLTGSGGHMTYIEYSAFDPIFFLHHAMVDRAFAMWQVLYPNSYVVPEASNYPTFTSEAGSTQDVSSPLTPFFEAGTQFWDSATSRSTVSFGYTYADLGTAEEVRTVINSLYGSGTGSNNSLQRRQSHDVACTASYCHEYREWIVNIRVNKHAIDGPFFIYVFVGSISSDSEAWPLEENLVGTHCVYSRAGPCVGCNQQVTATLPLTSVLKARSIGDLALSVSSVQPYLESNLRYRVASVGGGIESISDLQVTVVSAIVTRPANDTSFPIWERIEEQFTVAPDS